MTYCILTDKDVDQLNMLQAIGWLEEAFRQHASGTLVCPGRLVSDVESGQLVFTIGASTSDSPHVGFRVYDLKQLHSPDRSELTAVFDGTNGRLRGLVIGPLLGAIRTGAIGGVAIKYLSNEKSKRLGLVGTGSQAKTPLQAAVAVRDFESIVVYSRNPERRQQFAAQFSHELGRDIRTAETAQEACQDADVLICSTTSHSPVIEADWLKPGVHINTLGPKFKEASEIGLDVFARANRLVTDAPAQLEVYGERFLLHGTSTADSIVDLSSIVAAAENTSPMANSIETSPARNAEDITIFISLGLAGTEVVLANELFLGVP